MALVTFFSVLERPGKNRNGGSQQPPLVRRGLGAKYNCMGSIHHSVCTCWAIPLEIHIPLLKILEKSTTGGRGIKNQKKKKQTNIHTQTSKQTNNPTQQTNKQTNKHTFFEVLDQVYHKGSKHFISKCQRSLSTWYSLPLWELLLKSSTGGVEFQWSCSLQH